ncbi:MAG: XrtA-associated tyrosine autokinase [Gammaproteobacteria bacterium]|nr:XrtA-associated tyrosine autokinase [Gammaproteobacteria bacterium]
MSSIEKVVELLKKTAPGGPAVTQPNTVDGHDTADASQNTQKLNIDLDYLKEHGVITPDTMESVKAEEFRGLKRPILRNAFGRNAVLVDQGNMVMVTSSLPGEGKTFTALSLAMSIAVEKDTTVLLVDCDVVNPSLSRFLKIQDNPGLTDYLNDSGVGFNEIIISTDIENLKVMPAGRQFSQSTELLASERMEMLTTEISQRYNDRVILFDSPPLLLASQAAVLAQLMGQIIVIVEAEKTPKSAVKEAISLLDEDKAIGVVLNKTKKLSSKSYYGSYYGSYGSYGSPES